MCYIQQSPPLTLIHDFAFHGFSYPRSTMVQKYEIENSRNKQFHNFKLRAVVINVVKRLTRLPRCESSLCPASPHCLGFLPATHSSEQVWWYHRACVQDALTLLNYGPKAIHVTFITVYCYNCSIISYC